MPRRCTGGPGEERLWLVDWGLFSLDSLLPLDSRKSLASDGQSGVQRKKEMKSVIAPETSSR